jgi:hypothetical protein
MVKQNLTLSNLEVSFLNEEIEALQINKVNSF